jgi:opacity protein-like surface antigen
MEVTMKRMILAVSAMTLLMTGMAYAEAETPVIDQRQTSQEKRIDQGIASGQLNERETTRLNKQQGHINKMEDKAKSDGVVTKREKARIDHAQNRASRHIAREKHDRQGKRHQ